MTARAEWIDAIGREHVLSVAEALGLPVQAPRGSSGGSCACPACGAERRHPSRGDRRLAVGVRRDGGGWRCYECDAHGDQLHLAAVALEQRRWDELADDQKRRVREWVMGWLRLGGAPSVEPPPRRTFERTAPDAPPEYPPQAEVIALWESCVPVTRDTRVTDWLRKRALNARRLAGLDVCRVLPFGAPCPAWAGRPALEATETRPAREAKPWSRSAYRCLFGLYDAQGFMRSLLARFVGVPNEKRPAKVAQLKSRAAYGFERRGLVLADGAGVRLLRGESEGISRVVIGEGEMDLCSWAHAVADDGLATLAVVAGSWTPAHAERIPDGVTVVIATHLDEGGQRYARRIQETLDDRIRAGALEVKRWRP